MTGQSQAQIVYWGVPPSDHQSVSALADGLSGFQRTAQSAPPLPSVGPPASARMQVCVSRDACVAPTGRLSVEQMNSGLLQAARCSSAKAKDEPVAPAGSPPHRLTDGSGICNRGHNLMMTSLSIKHHFIGVWKHLMCLFDMLT